MKKLAALLALLLFTASCVPQEVVTALRHPIAASCTALTSPISDWQMWNASNTCAGGSACTNGAGIDKVVDIGSAANNLTQGTSGARPRYDTAQINGLAIANWVSASDLLSAGSVVTNGNTTTSWYAVLQPTVNGAVIVGSNGNTGSIEWGVNNTGHQYFNKSGVTAIATGTAVLSSASYHAIALTYNQPTGAWAFYVCSGGTCSSDGSGTSAVTFTAGVSTIGETGFGSTVVSQKFAEIAFYNTITLSNFGVHAQGCYAL